MLTVALPGLAKMVGGRRATRGARGTRFSPTSEAMLMLTSSGARLMDGQGERQR